MAVDWIPAFKETTLQPKQGFTVFQTTFLGCEVGKDVIDALK